MTTDDAITLWRPVGPTELRLIEGSDMRAFPPRLQEQPIFYPVLTEAYAVKIARDWNVRAYGAGYVTRFLVAKAFLDRYAAQEAGGREYREYWIPAKELAAFNSAIVGTIDVVAEFRACDGVIVRFRKIYDLHDDVTHVAQVQKATLESPRFGLVPEHGLFGTVAWWAAVRQGRIATHEVAGTITRVYMGSMGDWPEFEMRAIDERLVTWSRFGTVPDSEQAYHVGRWIHVDYVEQKPKSTEAMEIIKIPLSVWAEVHDAASADDCMHPA